MKKSATTEEKVAFVAKKLLKEFKASEKDASGISITSNFTEVCSNKYKGVHVIFRHGYGKDEVDFGELSEEGFGSITCKIADAICSKLKVKKNEILHRDSREDTVYHGGCFGWSSRYTTVKRIMVIRPCKEFFAINKKLKTLGLKEIFFKDWYHCDVAGKRSSIFSRHYTYYAESEGKCKKVLDYLKGKKKLTYDFVNCDDLEDRRRGEEYETEWYGSESKQIRFKDSKGKTTTIY